MGRKNLFHGKTAHTCSVLFPFTLLRQRSKGYCHMPAVSVTHLMLSSQITASFANLIHFIYSWLWAVRTALLQCFGQFFNPEVGNVFARWSPRHENISECTYKKPHEKAIKKRVNSPPTVNLCCSHVHVHNASFLAEWISERRMTFGGVNSS